MIFDYLPGIRIIYQISVGPGGGKVGTEGRIVMGKEASTEGYFPQPVIFLLNLSLFKKIYIFTLDHFGFMLPQTWSV